MATLRAIDRNQSVKKLPMRLLCLGASRTGTSSLCLALEKLGYKTFHMNECLAQPLRFFPLWIEALDAKFGGKGSGTPFGKPEFDRIFADYDACSDVPAVLFADELVEAYPDAKVILSERDPDRWIKSMQGTIYRVHSWSSWDWLQYWDSGFVALWRKCDLADWDAWLGQAGRRDFLSNEYAELSKQRLLEHNQHVKKIVPRDKLLVWRPEDGWEPLCNFLGHQVPKEEFPRAWDAETLINMSTVLWWSLLVKAVATTVFPVGLAVGIWYWWSSH